jgi:hydroxymethylpyrimidine/phosphomethylpyrimidine kinase
MIPSALTIAGSDSGGAAGLQADLRTFLTCGVHGLVAVTAVTVQNTLGVRDVFPIPPEVVRAQGEAVLDDIGADVIKVGMLGAPALVAAAAALIDRAGAPAVVDPVMTAKGGAALLASESVAVLKAELLPRAALLTPNAPEAEALTGIEVRTPGDLRRAGEALLGQGARAVLMKGGHVPGRSVVDILMTPAGERSFQAHRIDSRHTHGTGCTLASAIAAGLALGRELEAAVDDARAYVRGAILHAPGFGAGHGPMDHGWRLRPALFPATRSR